MIFEVLSNPDHFVILWSLLKQNKIIGWKLGEEIIKSDHK